VSTLDGIGFRFCMADVPVCAMMDARRGQVYCAVYRFDRGRLLVKTQDRVCAPDQAVAMVPEKDAVFAGSGVTVYESMIVQMTRNRARIAPPGMHSVRAATLALAARCTPDFFTDPANALVPAYLRSEGADAPRAFA
jgi:tRNA threonylcarbamoyladenosine biosynthesis protein TsaB